MYNMPDLNLTEKQFETDIEYSLLTYGNYGEIGGIILDNKNDINEAVFKILKDYCDFYEEEPISFKLNIAKNLSDEYKKIRPDLARSNRININEINDNNGITIPPKDDGDFTILLSKGYLTEELNKKSPNWIGTIAHEITHLYDFCKLKAISDFSYDDMLDYEKNMMFINWTEFNAKVKGYLYLRKTVFEDIYDHSQVEYIMQTELPYMIKYMYEEYSKTTNANRQLYVVSHFLAHLYVWQYLFPIDFSENVLEQIFSDNDWMRELYYFFYNNRNLEDAINNTEHFKKILRMNFQGV